MNSELDENEAEPDDDASVIGAELVDPTTAQIMNARTQFSDDQTAMEERPSSFPVLSTTSRCKKLKIDDCYTVRTDIESVEDAQAVTFDYGQIPLPERTAMEPSSLVGPDDYNNSMPAECKQSLGLTVNTRSWHCYTGSFTVIRKDRTQEVGRITVHTRSYVYTLPNSRVIGMTIAARVANKSGSIAATITSNKPTPTGGCFVSEYEPTAPIYATSTNWSYGHAFLETQTLGAGQVLNCTVRPQFHVSLTAGVVTSGNYTVSVSHPIRCDNALRGTGTPGCVIPVTADTNFFPYATSWASHVTQAIASGLPATLNRRYDVGAKNTSRKLSCPRSLNRPSGKSCDEYPFASTAQGASVAGKARTFHGCNVLGKVRTGPNGYSRCMIPVTDNSAGGGMLSAFYARNRILDGDRFRVTFQ
jgi:hypothetical protein